MQRILSYLEPLYCQDADYPVLARQDLGTSLRGLSILDATPLFNNTLTKYLPLLKAGADLTVGLSNKIPHDNALLEKLDALGLKYIWDTDNTMTFDIVMDCAGAFSSFTPRIGTVELTRSGIYHYSDAHFPVILADDSRIKNIETCLGTGDGFLRGMAKLGIKDWHEKKVVIFGFGKVGRGVAFYLQKNGACVTAIDAGTTPVPPGITLIDMADASAIASAVHDAYCVVTAIGKEGVLRNSPAIKEILSGRQLVTTISIEDDWGGALPPKRQLADGKTVNFLLDEPTQLKYIEATMALSNASALELICNKKNYANGINKPSETLQSTIWNDFEKFSKVFPEAIAAGL